jgi:hypothetical protein
MAEMILSFQTLPDKIVQRETSNEILPGVAAFCQAAKAGLLAIKDFFTQDASHKRSTIINYLLEMARCCATLR